MRPKEQRGYVLEGPTQLFGQYRVELKVFFIPQGKDREKK